MRAREMQRLQKALQRLRDPDGTGRTRVSHKRMGEDFFTCVKCHKPTNDQQLPEGTATCECA